MIEAKSEEPSSWVCCLGEEPFSSRSRKTWNCLLGSKTLQRSSLELHYDLPCHIWLFILQKFFFSFFVAMAWSLWDISSPTTDWTQAMTVTVPSSNIGRPGFSPKYSVLANPEEIFEKIQKWRRLDVSSLQFSYFLTWGTIYILFHKHRSCPLRNLGFWQADIEENYQATCLRGKKFCLPLWLADPLS